MQQEFYGIFYSKLKLKALSVILAKLCYLVFILKYRIQKLRIKKSISECENPYDIINSIYPKPEYEIEINAEPIDKNIDISVIIPIYNYKDLIRQCIYSVLNQKTQYNYEVILVDDGSTDGASSICDEYADLKNVVVIHQQNEGIGGARNTGLNNAKGKYIMFVDCDDFVHDDFIEVMLNEAYKTDNDVVICGYNLVKKQNGETVSVREVECSTKNLKGYKEDTIMNYQGLPWNKVYKRSVFENIRYIQGFWYEDTITHFLVFRKCKSFSYISQPLYDYMWYENNFSHTQARVQPKSLERYWLLEVMASETERIGLPLDKGFYKVLLRHSGALLYSGVNGLDENVQKAVFTLCSNLIQKFKTTEKYHLTYFEKELEKAILTKDINCWVLLSRYI